MELFGDLFQNPAEHRAIKDPGRHTTSHLRVLYHLRQEGPCRAPLGNQIYWTNIYDFNSSFS